MTASHAEATEAEYAAHQIWNEARLLATLPVAELMAERDTLIEARELLNDELARIDRALERRGMASMFERVN